MSGMGTTPQPARYATTLARAAWPDPLFRDDLAAVLGLSPVAAVRFVRREGIPALRIGRRLAVRAATLARWMADAEVAAVAGDAAATGDRP